MKKATLFGLALAGALLLFPATSQAAPGFGFEFGFGGRHGGFRASFGGSHRHHGRIYRDSCRPAPVRHVHAHSWAPYYENAWVPPVSRTVFAGYDHHGYPVYREVCVRAGYHRQVLRGHRCGCGAYR